MPSAPDLRPAPPFDLPRVGVAVIVRRGDHVLLGLRRSTTHGDGVWQFPGGHLEWGEAVEDCARREVEEETGLTVAIDALGPWTSDWFPESGRHYVTVFLLATSPEGDAQVREPDKCEQWGWFRWDALPAPLFLPILGLQRQGFDPFAADPVVPAG
jgi:8-oxo-dGTP diphosphatase